MLVSSRPMVGRPSVVVRTPGVVCTVSTLVLVIVSVASRTRRQVPLPRFAATAAAIIAEAMALVSGSARGSHRLRAVSGVTSPRVRFLCSVSDRAVRVRISFGAAR